MRVDDTVADDGSFLVEARHERVDVVSPTTARTAKLVPSPRTTDARRRRRAIKFLYEVRERHTARATRTIDDYFCRPCDTTHRVALKRVGSTREKERADLLVVPKTIA